MTGRDELLERAAVAVALAAMELAAGQPRVHAPAAGAGAARAEQAFEIVPARGGRRNAADRAPRAHPPLTGGSNASSAPCLSGASGRASRSSIATARCERNDASFGWACSSNASASTTRLPSGSSSVSRARPAASRACAKNSTVIVTLDAPWARPYAAPMHESNPGPAGESAPLSGPLSGSESGRAPIPDLAAAAAIPENSTLDPSHPSDAATFERRISVLHGLRVWFGLIAGLGILSAIANMAELPLMVTLAAVFVSAHAADRDGSFEKLRLVLSGIFVIGAAMSFGGLAVYLANNGPHNALRIPAIGIAGGGAIACLVTSWRPFADGLSHLFFRTSETSHTLRLGARVVLMILILAVPGWVAAPMLLESLQEVQEPLLDAGSVVSTLIGMTLLSLGAVGFLIKRDVRETLDRLGLTRLRLRHVGVVLLGVVALYLINLGSETLQRLWFPDQWAHDQQINQMLAGGITVAGAILVGVGAGVGEELAMRGALQPKLGLVLTSLAFASLHVHYSWFGIAMIFVLGMTLGWIRIRTSTSVSILVHTLYDIAAVLATVGLPKP